MTRTTLMTLVIAALVAFSLFNINDANAKAKQLDTAAAAGLVANDALEQGAGNAKLIKELKSELRRIETITSRNRTRACGEIADSVCREEFDQAMDDMELTIDYARTTCLRGDAHVCQKAYDRAMTTVNRQVRGLSNEVDSLHAEPKPMLSVAVTGGAQKHASASKYDIGTSNAALGVNIATGLETHGFGLTVGGFWQGLPSSFGGHRLGGEVLAYSRQTMLRKWSWGGGFSLATTRLISETDDLLYQSTGPGLSLILLRRSGEMSRISKGAYWKRSYADMHTQMWFKVNIAREDTHVAGASHGPQTTALLEFGFGGVVGGRAGYTQDYGWLDH